MKLKFLVAFLLINPVIVSSNAQAWNFRGHVLAAQIAYNNLSDTAQQQAKQYAEMIFSRLSRRQQQKLQQEYPSASIFAQIATLPDTWRHKTVEQIFQRYGAPLPKALEKQRDADSSHWHYTNESFPHRDCATDPKPNVVWAINTLEKAWKNTDNPHSKAVMMVMLAHYVADAHQPLHAYSKTNPNCENDLGGNRYQVRDGNNRVIKLHKLWDEGVGYLTQSLNVANKAWCLQNEFPAKDFSLTTRDPLDWIKQYAESMPFIYSIAYDHKISASYYAKGQDIVRYQLSLSGYRLAVILNVLL